MAISYPYPINLITFDYAMEKAADEDVAIGGEAIARKLSLVDVPARKDQIRREMFGAKGQRLSNLNREYRFLDGLDKMGKTPTDAYTLTKLPVLPPAFRPITVDNDGKLIIPAINKMYNDIGTINLNLKDPSLKDLPTDMQSDLERGLYDAASKVVGVANADSWSKDDKGILKTLAGTSSPKGGFFQSRVMSRRQNVSGRSVITVDPDLGVDEIGLPEEMAWTVYRPFVVRKMTGAGMMTSDAMKEVDERSTIAKNALEATMAERPALINRAPSLHKFSIMAARPKLSPGRDIKVNPFIISGMGADFDGDTTAIHIPMGEAAREEAFNMLPSKHLTKPGAHTMMLKPSQAATLGLFMLTRAEGNPTASFSSEQEALRALKAGSINAEQPIAIGGEKTSAGRLLVGRVLPAGTPFGTLDDKGIEEVLTGIAQKSPKKYADVVKGLRRVGDDHITNKGFTIGLDDLTPISGARDSLVRRAAATVRPHITKNISEEDKRKIMGDVYGKVADRLEKYLSSKKFVNTHPIAQMVASGSRGKISQMRQMLATPLMAEDAQDNLIPIPINKSYVEGLDTQEYWAAGYGVRKGIVGRSHQTSKPGALAKELLASISDVVISDDNKIEPSSIKLSLDRTDDVADRFLAKSVVGKTGKILMRKGQLVTSDIVPRLKKAGVRDVDVYTPLNSEGPDGGVPAKAFGLNERGSMPEPGDNIGVLSGHAITEPISQMTMKAFHSGGTIGSGSNIPEGFERVQQLLQLPQNVAGKATLSTMAGQVSSVTPAPAGGFYVRVRDDEGDEKAHYVPTHRRVNVAQGARVVAGDTLSDGVIKPQELLEHKGLEATQGYMVDELQKALPGTRRKYLETVVAGMTNRVRVVDPGDKEGLIPNDIVPTHVVKSHNAKSWTKDIKYDPILKGVNRLPITKAEDNWMVGMNYRELGKLLIDSTLENRRAETHSWNPVPAFARGEFFGTGEGGKY